MHSTQKKESSLLIIIAAIASVVAILGITISLVLSLGKNILPRLGNTAVEMTDAEKAKMIDERLKPITTINIGSIATASVKAQDPKEIFETLCSTCHTVEGVGAPLVTNKVEWTKRFNEQGYDKLVHTSLNGLNAMPARGGNPKLSDQEVIGAFRYMIGEIVGIELPKIEAPKTEASSEVNEDINLKQVQPKVTDEAAAPQ